MNTKKRPTKWDSRKWIADGVVGANVPVSPGASVENIRHDRWAVKSQFDEAIHDMASNITEQVRESCEREGGCVIRCELPDTMQDDKGIVSALFTCALMEGDSMMDSCQGLAESAAETLADGITRIRNAGSEAIRLASSVPVVLRR